MKKIIFLLISLLLFIPSTKIGSQRGSVYCVLDATNNIVIKGNDFHTPYLIASTAKILTAIVCIEYQDLENKITVEKEDTLMEGSKVYLMEDDEISFYDLLCGLMLRSGNDCANAIARETFNNYDFFVYMMNLKAKEIGMEECEFNNPSGLDSKNENKCSAYNLALLLSYAMKNEQFHEIASKTKYDTVTKMTSYHWINKDKLVRSETGFVAGKTGYTKKSGRILVNYVIHHDKPFVIVTINEGNDWAVHKSLYNSLTNTSSYKLYDSSIFFINKRYKFLEKIEIECYKEYQKDFRYEMFDDKIMLYLNNVFVGQIFI